MASVSAIGAERGIGDQRVQSGAVEKHGDRFRVPSPYVRFEQHETRLSCHSPRQVLQFRSMGGGNTQNC